MGKKLSIFLESIHYLFSLTIRRYTPPRETHDSVGLIKQRSAISMDFLITERKKKKRKEKKASDPHIVRHYSTPPADVGW